MHQNDPGDESDAAFGEGMGILPNRRKRTRREWTVEEVIENGVCPFCRGDVIPDYETGALVCPKCLTARPFHEEGIFYTSPDACGVNVDPTKGDE